MPLLNYRFPDMGINIYELGDLGLTPKQVQDHPLLRLEEVSYGADGIASPYTAENLVEIDGTRLPFIAYARFSDIFSLELKVLDGKYQRRSPITVVEKQLKKARISPNHTDGQVINVCDWKVLENGGLEITGRQAGYFDLLVSNMCQDVALSKLDDRFKPGESFRKMEVSNGRKTPFKESFLANTLGAGYLIRAGKDDVYIFGRRRRNLAVEGGTWSVIGTTPVWRDYFRDQRRRNKRGNMEMGYTFMEYTMKELWEELCLDPWEVQFKAGWLVDELYRGPALFTIFETPVDMAEIVDRCRDPEKIKAREEHDYLMSVKPLTPKLLSGFHQGVSLRNGMHIYHKPSELLPDSATGVSLQGKFSLNEGSLTLIKLALDEFRE